MLLEGGINADFKTTFLLFAWNLRQRSQPTFVSSIQNSIP